MQTPAVAGTHYWPKSVISDLAVSLTINLFLRLLTVFASYS